MTPFVARRKRVFICSIALLALTVGCNPNVDPNTALDTFCNNAGCVSAKKFSAAMDAQLQGKVTGYVSIVGGGLPVIVTYGDARTSTDAPARKMDTDVPINVASVSKFLTSIRVLQSMAAHNLTIDSKIAPFLPPDWQLGANVNSITFRDLLTHRAGFRNGDQNATYDSLKQQIATNINLTDKATAKYNNLNFALFRVLLPYMEGFNDPGAAARATATANFYGDTMRQHVFQPVGVSNVACKPQNNSHPALAYPFPPGNAHGYDWGDWTLTCGGGGWVLSASDLFKVLLARVGGTTLLTDAQKTLMDSNCLGWDCSVQNQTDFVGKNGLLFGANSGLETFVGIFKGNMMVILLVNSNPGPNITSIVVKAFGQAGVAHP
jgi:CubicO group peptidase (beta-lactamase class C family)